MEEEKPIEKEKEQLGDVDKFRSQLRKSVKSAPPTAAALHDITWGAVADAQVDDEPVKKPRKNDEGDDSDDEAAAIEEERRVKALLETQWGVERDDERDEYYDRTDENVRRKAREERTVLTKSSSVMCYCNA